MSIVRRSTTQDRRTRYCAPRADKHGVTDSRTADLVGFVSFSIESRLRAGYAARVVRARKSPWWQVTGSPRTGFIVGGVWILIFVSRLLIALDEGEWPWYEVLFSILTASLSAVYFGSAIALLKSRSRLGGPPTR